MKRYLVGGAVRDSLLGLAVTERDWVVVGATPEQMRTLGYQPVGKDFPVFLHPETHEEHALARTERKTGHGYHDFQFHTDPSVTLEDDLIRRDLTINAIAQDDNGQLIDPYGGQRDLNDKILRHVSTAFTEDPVRILRIARFHARFAPLGFQIAPETRTLMQQMVQAGEVDHLVPERVWQELARALMHERPSRFIQTLRDCGALARILPEVDALFAVPQRADYHPEVDSGIHTLMCIDAAARMGFGLEVRVMALLHDLGKALTPHEEWPSHRGHEARGVPLVQQVCARLRIPNAIRDLAVSHTREHLRIHNAQQLRDNTLLELLDNIHALRRPEAFERILEASLCDARGRTTFENCAYPQNDYLRVAARVANQVQAAEVLADGYSGIHVGEQLKRRRQRRLGLWMTAQRRPDSNPETLE